MFLLLLFLLSIECSGFQKVTSFRITYNKFNQLSNFFELATSTRSHFRKVKIHRKHLKERYYISMM